MILLAVLPARACAAPARRAGGRMKMPIASGPLPGAPGARPANRSPAPRPGRRRAAAAPTAARCPSSRRGPARARRNRRRDHRLELVGGDEVVVLGMALARPRLARGERDRQAQARIARQHRVDDARLAGARGRGDDEFRVPGTDSRSFDVLDLLADLVDQHLQLHRRVGGARVDRLAAERVRLAVEFLQQEVRAPADRLALPQHAAQFADVAVEAVELPRRRPASAARSPVPARAGRVRARNQTRPAAFPASAAGRRGFAAPARAPRRRCRRWRRRVRRSPRSPASRPRVRARRRNRRAPRRARPAPRPKASGSTARSAARRAIAATRRVHAHAGEAPVRRAGRLPTTDRGSTCARRRVRSCAGKRMARSKLPRDTPMRGDAFAQRRVRTRAIRQAGGRPRGKRWLTARTTDQATPLVEGLPRRRRGGHAADRTMRFGRAGREW